VKKAAFLAIIALAAVFCAAPLLWQASTSLKTGPELDRFTYFPHSWYTDNYDVVFANKPFQKTIANSLVVAAAATALSLACASLAAFALAKLRVPYKPVILLFILSTSMFPQIAIISPLYLLIRALGLRDTLAALILVYTSFSLPLAIWVLHGFFEAVPGEIYTAARVDGCTAGQTFRKIALPLVAPGLAAAGILVFLAAWSEFMFANTFTATTASRTLPVGILLFSGLHEIPFGEIAAASMAAVAPVFVLVLLFQKYIVAGLTAGGVKG
jgi:multiple sugar transport system permease protein